MSCGLEPCSTIDHGPGGFADTVTVVDCADGVTFVDAPRRVFIPENRRPPRRRLLTSSRIALRATLAISRPILRCPAISALATWLVRSAGSAPVLVRTNSIAWSGVGAGGPGGAGPVELERADRDLLAGRPGGLRVGDEPFGREFGGVRRVLGGDVRVGRVRVARVGVGPLHGLFGAGPGDDLGV